ncbi:AtpZ/AtpI family protein [Bartonella sp. CB178]|uniref:AtpZ/AtpI family protein n=1 Tax=Bartonella sp. CB178 TaxID=3112255 RepID=UPI00300DDAD7
MAEGGGRVVLEESSEKEERGGCLSSGSLEHRGRRLGFALMRRQVSKEYGPDDGQRGEPRGRVAQAVELSSEFFASVVVGVVLGLGFDRLVDSSPWGLVFFLLLGFAAGVLNVLRFVGYVSSDRLGENGARRQDRETDKRFDR